MLNRTLIKDMAPHELVEGIFTVNNCQLGLTRNGKPFIKCLLSDKSGQLPGRMWNADEDLFQSLPTDGFVRIEGQTQPYQGELQIIIQHITTAEPATEELADLLPHTPFDIEQMFAQLTGLLETLKHPAMKMLAEVYLADEELMGAFKQAPAASKLHHAYIGGLLEHTLHVMKVADALLPLYPKINRDLVLIGLFVHDLGKCAELSWHNGFNYTDEGRLVGHIARGALWLQAKADECAMEGRPLDEAALNVLMHMVLSHHGEPEFGAVMRPSSPEALMVSLIDNLDAKMFQGIAAGRGDGAKPEALGGNFTGRIFGLDTRIYRPDPLADESTT